MPGVPFSPVLMSQMAPSPLVELHRAIPVERDRAFDVFSLDLEMDGTRHRRSSVDGAPRLRRDKPLS
jgi:hypothetical protein